LHAHERFIEINEAYLLLHDDEARAKYDKEFQSYYTKEQKTQTEQKKETKEETFEDFDLNDWSKKAKKQAEQYSKMPYADFYNLLLGIVKETGFQFSNVIVYIIAGVLLITGIGCLFRSNYVLGIILIVMAIGGQSLASKRWDEH